MRVGVIIPMSDESQPGVPQNYAEIRVLAQHAESAGFDSLWVYDHLLADTTENAGASPWEAWTVLAALADATSTIRLGTLVLCTAFRPPSVLARMADTLADISQGRLILGLGAGWHEAEFKAFGLPFDHRVGRFAEALQVVAEMLKSGRSTVEGTYQQLADAPVRLRPDRPVPPILVAGVRPRMLQLTAQYADQWNLAWFCLPGDRFREANRALDRACQDVGRDPATLERTVGLRISAPSGPGATDVDADAGRVIRGDAADIAAAFAAWSAEGVSEVICWPDPSDAATLDLVADAYTEFRRQRAAAS